MLKIAFIEDDLNTLKSLQEVLKLQPAIVCSVAAESVESFWELLPDRVVLDVIFVDIQLPGLSGLEVLPNLKKRFPDAEIVMFTQFEEEEHLLKALHAGASGYLLKGFPILQLPEMIQSIALGGALISPKMAKKLITYHNPTSSPTSDLLSPKELQILKIFAAGESYEEAAEMLSMTIDGIRYHVKNIYKKLHVNNKIDAIRALKDELI
ncbi:MAG: response regulator [Saprospiraceae bacterium]|jgi:DNA-binding NarL/FixJ family response regulator|nr:response regulator transcription factor [Saprospiraceae bacterium]